ncbi:MAG: primosomal protein N', partial [Chitinophagales bacterium]|nr:primosomal protein N' [Chitinophagales bacterium]
RMQGSFSTFLVDEISDTLHRKEQVILFINRRGFANYQICKTCNHVYKCKNCDVSLTYHKFSHQLKCHYCGYFENAQNKCKSCGAIDLDIVGSGTQKIEDELAELFPVARIGRLDYDATKTKNGHAEIISKFENREIDILVGTQMVSKGLDFDHVTLVGVINADQLIFHPGFRSFERAFQLLTQVAGRAGRRSKKGRVVLQTADPTHPVIQNVIHNNFKAMYERELTTRRQFLYPPFARVIEVQLRHKEVQRVEKAALFLANQLRKIEQGKILGPATPYISRINNLYIRDVLLKSTTQTKDLTGMKNALQHIIDQMKALPELKGVMIHVNVDP